MHDHLQYCCSKNHMKSKQHVQDSYQECQPWKYRCSTQRRIWIALEGKSHNLPPTRQYEMV